MEHSKALKMKELEELYLGIPDDSVNLTFQHLANVKNKSNSPHKKTQETKNIPLNKLPSLDFSKALQESKNHHLQNHHDIHRDGHKVSHASHHHHHHGGYGEFSRAYDNDMSMMSMNSMYQEKGGRSRRPGIPHSNICTVCSTYIYIFRHRCLVCGRVYCRNCVDIGMGEMIEGRKCIQCLGRKFSQRYIQRAGIVGCCSGYASRVKQAELIWAEKGPRRSGGERQFGHSSVSRLPPKTPHLDGNHNHNPPSFVSASSFSPYSPNHLHLPL